MEKEITLMEFVLGRIKGFTPIAKVEVISNVLAMLESENEQILDDENKKWKLNDVLYDSVKDKFVFVTKEAK